MKIAIWQLEACPNIKAISTGSEMLLLLKRIDYLLITRKHRLIDMAILGL